MRLIKGSLLNKNQRRQVLDAFVHRYTGDHRPEWSNKPMPNGNEYKPLFTTDEDWLKAYQFYFRDDGTLANKPRHCVPVEIEG